MTATMRRIARQNYGPPPEMLQLEQAPRPEPGPGEALIRVRALGADHVVDYTREDFTASGERYHLILNVLGGRSFSDVRGSLTHDGLYLLARFKAPHFAWALRTRLGTGPRVRCVG